MFLEETPEQLALRRELRAYYAELMTDEVRRGVGEAGEGGRMWRQVVGRIGEDGWLGIGWPTKYGGQGRPATDQYVFFDETRRAGAPFPFVTVNTVGPTIMGYGSDEQKAFFLPGILAGQINFAIGYTEPEAGTDLASLRTRAVRHGDEYVVNGAKVFTSGADMADYIWLAVRTDPDAPKHKGISILCLATDAAGFSWSPIATVGGATTTATYYADVRVPLSNRVGAENEGWRMITTQLNHERVGLAAWSGFAAQMWEEVVAWAATSSTTEGSPVLGLPWVQADLARCHAELEAMRLLNWRMACALATDTVSPAQSSAVKVFGVERSIDVYRRLLGIVGAAGYLSPGSPGEVLRGRLERAARGAQVNTFGGGVNEVQREIVATAGLGMTGSPVSEAFLAGLRAFEGREECPPQAAPEPVNEAMIHHWVEAMGDENPVYVDEAAARANGFTGIVAPPTMLQAWTMRGYRASVEAERARATNSAGEHSPHDHAGEHSPHDHAGEHSPHDQLRALFDEAGFTSVVATDCEQEYFRPVVLGERLSATSVVEAMSPEKHTALGDGHFVTTRMDFTDESGEAVATMRFRILRFRPRPAGASRPNRPRPGITPDNAFFFEGAKEGKLLVQRCAACARLRHPPRPACPHCGSFEWDTVESTRRATLFSYVVVHHPQVPGFDYPLPVAVVELEEGTRLVADVVGAQGPELTIGMPGTVELVGVDDELTLPMFRPGGSVMDFAFTDEQQAVSQAAAAVFDGMARAARVEEVEHSATRFDPELWAALAAAQLLGLAVPEAHGGSGLGLTEVCLVLEHQGRTVAPVPLWATAVLGAMPLARFGSQSSRGRLLPGVVSGQVRLSAALTEVAASPGRRPAVTASAEGHGWRLEGVTQAVPQAHVATAVVVPAVAGDDVVLVLVDPSGPGARLERAETTDRQIHPHLHLDGAPVGADDVLAGPGEGRFALEWTLERAVAGLCALQLGVAEEAVRRAAAHLNERHQFGRPLASFQGAKLRAADAFIDTEAMRVTLWQAAWRLDTDRPAARAVSVAKWWASESGQAVVHATQHLHGGLGADIGYPVHRYFLWGKQIELMLGGPSAQLARLGSLIADECVVEVPR